MTSMRSKLGLLFAVVSLVGSAAGLLVGVGSAAAEEGGSAAAAAAGSTAADRAAADRAAAIARAQATRKKARGRTVEAREKADAAAQEKKDKAEARKARASIPVHPKDAHSDTGQRRAFQAHWPEKDALLPLLNWAHGLLSARRNRTVAARDLGELVLTALNPDGHAVVHPEERAIVAGEVAALRAEEGLEQDGMPLHHGYLMRGAPLRWLQHLGRLLAEHRSRLDEL